MVRESYVHDDNIRPFPIGTRQNMTMAREMRRPEGRAG